MYEHSNFPPQLSIKTEERQMEKHHVKLNLGLVAGTVGVDLLSQ
jgi:hypothetical protein